MKDSESEFEITKLFSGGVDNLVFWSFRYFLGRMTIVTTVFAQNLAAAWPLLSGVTKDLIKRELEDAFERDDRCRKEGVTYKPLGDDCDREGWQLVRNKYSEPCHAAQ